MGVARHGHFQHDESPGALEIIPRFRADATSTSIVEPDLFFLSRFSELLFEDIYPNSQSKCPVELAMRMEGAGLCENQPSMRGAFSRH